MTDYVKTVHCFTDKNLRKHFVTVEGAAAYANALIKQGHVVRMFNYNPKYEAGCYADFIAAEAPPPWYRSEDASKQHYVIIECRGCVHLNYRLFRPSESSPDLYEVKEN